MLQVFASAFDDIVAALRRHHLWVALAAEDVGDQHKRTRLGPFWLLINYLLFAGTFILVFNQSTTPQPGYAAYVATGLLVWLYLAEVTSLGVALFTREESFIKGTPLPLTIYVLRTTLQTVIRDGYALLGCLFILLLSGTALSFGWVWAALGLFLLIVATPAAIILLAFLGAYFPDSQFIISNVMRVGMFLTPVFWQYEGSGGIQHVFYHWNPFTYFIEIVRIPILTGTFPAQYFAVCATVTLGLWIAALFVLGKLRKQVVFLL
jgi:lipopolysaccharide transport system permease protein